MRFRRQKHVDKGKSSWTEISLAAQSREKSTTGLVAQIGTHTVKSGSRTSELDSTERGRSRASTLWWEGVKLDYPCDPCTWIWEFWWKLTSEVTDLRLILWRIGWEQDPERNTLIHDIFQVQERGQDGDLSIKKVLTAKNCADVGTKPVFASVLLQHCKIAGDWPWIPKLHYKIMGHLWNRVGARRTKQKDTDHCRNWLWTLRRMQNWVKPWKRGRVEHFTR